MTKDISKIPGKNVFEACLYDDSFLADVAQIRALKSGSIEELAQGTHTAQLIDKYGIPSWFMDMLHHYIESDDEIDWSLVRMPVRVEKTEGGVVLRLSHDVKQTQLKQYISDYFRQDIKPLLDEVAGERRKRHSAPYYPAQHQKAQRLHEARKKLAINNEAIAQKSHIGSRTVSRAVQQNKKKK